MHVVIGDRVRVKKNSKTSALGLDGMVGRVAGWKKRIGIAKVRNDCGQYHFVRLEYLETIN